jgi:hypothetical protein
VQPYLKSFEKRMGRPLYGLKDFATLSAKLFDEPAFSKILMDIIHQDVALGFLGAGNSLKTQDRDAGLDAGFYGGYSNLKFGTEEHAYLSELLSLYAGEVTKLPGEAIHFSYFEGGKKDGSLAKLNGKPVVLTLGKPFFNHESNVQVVQDLELDNPDVAAGGTIKTTAMAEGELNLNQIIVNLAVASGLSGGFEGSPSYERLFADGESLRKTLKAYQTCLKSAESGKSAAQCNQMAESAVPAATIALKFYREAQGLASNP